MLEFFRILIYYPFLNLLTFIIWLTPGHFAAVGIIALTLLVRFLLIVPSRKAAQAQRKISQMQPLIDDLKKEYADDRQGLAMAQMELYKKNEINPFGSCLLSLVQIPLLIVLYHAIRDGLTPNNPHLYDWVPRAEFINTNFFGIELTAADATYILPIVAAVFQFVQIKMTMAKPKKPAPGEIPDPTAMMQRSMIYMLPLLTLVFARSLPAAIALYWIVTTAFSIVQQYFVNREKYNLKGVEKVMEDADKKHPEYHRPKKTEEKILEETSNKKGVSVTVRRKKS